MAARIAFVERWRRPSSTACLKQQFNRRRSHRLASPVFKLAAAVLALSAASLSLAGTLCGVLLHGVYCVCPETRHGRWLSMQRHLKGLGILANRWCGTDASSPDFPASIPQLVEEGLLEAAALPRQLVQDEWREQWRATRRWRRTRRGPWQASIDLTRMALGQALSHMGLWSEIARQSLRGASSDGGRAAYLVIDADFRLLPEFSLRELEARVAEIPDDWDIIFLGATDLFGCDSGTAQKSLGVRPLCPWLRPASAYLVTATGARNALDVCMPLQWQFDLQLAGQHASTLSGVDAEDRARYVFAPPATPVGYCLAPPLVELAEGRAEGRTRGLLAGKTPPLDLEAKEGELYKELDWIITWAMRITDYPVPRGSREREIEGHSNMIKEARENINRLAATPGVETICEIGFNGGHGTLRWLLHSKARVYSFDLGEHDYSRPAAKWLSAKFPGRLEVIWGDSVKTLPEFIRCHPEIQCDLVFVDGGHSFEVAMADLESGAAMARPGNTTLVLVDDTHLFGVIGAWETMKSSGRAEELNSTSGFAEGVGNFAFALGRYTIQGGVQA